MAKTASSEKGVEFSQNFEEIWVQTEWMAGLVKAQFHDKRIFKKPFLPQFPPPVDIEKKYDLITVSSLSPHKNFKTFLCALVLLDQKVARPISVLAVLDSNLNSKEVVRPKLTNIKLDVYTKMSREELFRSYQQSKIAIVTSSLESFCLPIYEAVHFNLKVLSLDTPFARECESVRFFYKSNTDVDLSMAINNIVNLKLS